MKVRKERQTNNYNTRVDLIKTVEILLEYKFVSNKREMLNYVDAIKQENFCLDILRLSCFASEKKELCTTKNINCQWIFLYQKSKLSTDTPTVGTYVSDCMYIAKTSNFKLATDSAKQLPKREVILRNKNSSVMSLQNWHPVIVAKITIA